MRMIDGDVLLAEYDRVHEGPPGRARKLIEQAPAIEPEQEKGKWIPCSERLPEYGKTVLWCNDKGSIFTTAITYMNGTSWAVGKKHRRCQVVAWMPLPEPYAERNTDETD